MFYTTARNVCWIKFDYLHLNDKDPLKLYPAVDRIERKKGSNFSIICTTECMRYYSRNFNWFKGSGVLSHTTNVVIHPTFLRLDFSALERTLVYTNVILWTMQVFKRNVFNWLCLVSDLICFNKWHKLGLLEHASSNFLKEELL